MRKKTTKTRSVSAGKGEEIVASMMIASMKWDWGSTTFLGQVRVGEGTERNSRVTSRLGDKKLLDMRLDVLDRKYENLPWDKGRTFKGRERQVVGGRFRKRNWKFVWRLDSFFRCYFSLGKEGISVRIR